MYKNNLARKIVLTVMAASVLGVSSAYAAEEFPTTNTTVSGNADYETKALITDKNYMISGDGINQVTVVNGEGIDEGKGVILAQGQSNIKISNLDSFTLNNTKAMDGLSSWARSTIDISGVNTVNIGTINDRFTGGDAIHAASGWVKLTDIGDLNIYTDGQGIMAQNAVGKAVDIQANGDVTIDANQGAIVAQSINSNPGEATASVIAKGKVTLTAHKYGWMTVYSGDESGQYHGKGKTNIVISGDQGVDIVHDSYIGIYMARKHEKNDSTLDIISEHGDVNITAAQDAILIKPATNNGEVATDTGISGKITGNNITITSKTGSAANINNSSLNLAGNQDNSTITLTGGNGTAVSTTGSKGKLTIGDGSYNTNVIVNGTIKITDNSNVNLAANTTTRIDASKLSAGTLINVSDGGKFIADNGAKLYVANAEKGGNYKLINDANNSTLWKDTTLELDNKFLKADIKGTDLIISNETKTAKEALGISTVIDNVVAKAGNDGKGAMFDFVNDVASSNVNADTKATALNSAANIGELGGTSHGTYSMSNIMTDAVTDHLSLATHGEQDKDVWAHYIHNKENVSGLALGGVEANYDAQYNGIVVGSDLYKNGKATVGFALSYAEGNIDGSTLAARTSNDAEYYGASIYGRIDNGDSAVLGDISYLHSKNDIEQTNSGKTITASPKADAFSVGVKAEQVFNAGVAKFVPYAGLRYMHLGIGNYEDSLGMGYNGDEQNLWLLPVGVTYSQDIKAGSWTIRPVVEAGYVWTMGDRDTQQTVSLNGASDGFGFDVADSGSFISRFAVEAEKANVTYGLGYEYQKGDTVKANKWLANVNFSF